MNFRPTRKMGIKRIFCYICSSLALFILADHLFLLNYAGSLKFWASSGHQELRAKKKVEIWGKASVGEYLWIHILGGETETVSNGFFQVGTINFEDMEFIFRSGPGYIQTTVPQDVSHLILVINGRTTDKVTNAKEWLDYLPNLVKLRKTAVILLGNEACENDWILPYLRSRGGLLDILFIIYDSQLVDNKEVFQWPLGVAVYRGFPNIMPSSVNLKAPRPFKCNFVGTIYQNSSRQILNSILKSSKFHYNCYVSTRAEWTPNETNLSSAQYAEALLSSDLTLSPVGQNTECYRIYEAMSFGSVPVVEDVRTPGKCASPLRLLKRYNAPIIYVKDWNKLDDVFLQEENLTNKEIFHRRETVAQWYANFKNDFGNIFINLIRSRFYGMM